MGLSLIMNMLIQKQNEQKFVQFCFIATILLEFELSLFENLKEQMNPNKQKVQANNNIQQILLKNKMRKEVLAQNCHININKEMANPASLININQIRVFNMSH